MPRTNANDMILKIGEFKMSVREMRRNSYFICRYLLVEEKISINLESARKLMEIISETKGFSNIDFSKKEGLIKIINKIKEMIKEEEWKEIIKSM